MQESLKLLEENVTLLAPSKHLAVHLRKTFEIEQQLKGKTLWPTPRIYAIDHWLGLTWEECQ